MSIIYDVYLMSNRVVHPVSNMLLETNTVIDIIRFDILEHCCLMVTYKLFIFGLYSFITRCQPKDRLCSADCIMKTDWLVATCEQK